MKISACTDTFQKCVVCFQEKHLSGFWWPSIIDMEMNNYADALLLFLWKKEDAMFTHPYLILEGSHIHIREIHRT